jgi:acetyl-CoA acetyltransferase
METRKMMKGIVIVGGVRTVIGDFDGAFKEISASQLSANVIKETAGRGSPGSGGT